jgi:hypothetical protein
VRRVCVVSCRVCVVSCRVVSCAYKVKYSRQRGLVSERVDTEVWNLLLPNLISTYGWVTVCHHTHTTPANKQIAQT